MSGLLRALLLRASDSQWLRERGARTAVARAAASRFFPGETLDDALAAARELGLPVILTRLGENVTDLATAEATARHYLDVLDACAAHDVDGQISVKPTQLGLDVDRERCAAWLLELADHAEQAGTRVWIDMEQSRYVDATLDLYRRTSARHGNVGICLQAYLRRTARDLEGLVDRGGAVRLVKGAYREPEAVAYPRKRDVDDNFLALAQRMLALSSRAPGLHAVFGTHDEQLIESIRRYASAAAIGPLYGSKREFRTRCAATQVGEPPTASVSEPYGGPSRATRGQRYWQPDAYEFHLLFGIQRRLQARLARDGHVVRVLVSYGDQWFPWYMRRLAERPANLLFAAKSLVSR
jgi:proline dehydrogenase